MSAFFCAEFSAQGVRNTQSLCIFGIYDYTERPLTLGHSLQHSNTPFNTRKLNFHTSETQKNQLFRFFSKLPRHGPVSQCYRSIKSMQNSYFFSVASIVHPTTRFGDWIQKSSNYAVRGLDQKVYTSVEAAVCLWKCAHKGQRLSNILRYFKYF